MVRRKERFEPIPENEQTCAQLYDAYCRGCEGLDRSGAHAALADLQKQTTGLSGRGEKRSHAGVHRCFIAPRPDSCTPLVINIAQEDGL
jgi:hypothetical protein